MTSTLPENSRTNKEQGSGMLRINENDKNTLPEDMREEKVTGYYDAAQDTVHLSNGDIIPWSDMRDYCLVTAKNEVHRYEPSSITAHRGPKMMSTLSTYSDDLRPFVKSRPLYPDIRERVAKMAGLVELPESVFLPVDQLMALLEETDRKAREDMCNQVLKINGNNFVGNGESEIHWQIRNYRESLANSQNSTKLGLQSPSKESK